MKDEVVHALRRGGGVFRSLPRCRLFKRFPALRQRVSRRRAALGGRREAQRVNVIASIHGRP